MKTRSGLVMYGGLPDEAEAFERAFSNERLPIRFVEDEFAPDLACFAKDFAIVSVSHRANIGKMELSALKAAGVECVITRSVGTDHIDIQEARRLKISIKTSPYSPGSVADFTLMLMLMVLRGVKAGFRNAREASQGSAVCGKELGDMTVGVIGPGRIGNAVLKRLEGFGCSVLICGREQSSTSVSLEELLASSDVVTLHVPLTAETHHLIGRKEMDAMKPGAVLVNTGRGALVEAEALVDALKERRLGGAALDVVEGENDDPSRNREMLRHLETLRAMPNVVITPHVAYFTDHAMEDMARSALRECREHEKEGGSDEQAQGFGPIRRVL